MTNRYRYSNGAANKRGPSWARCYINLSTNGSIFWSEFGMRMQLEKKPKIRSIETIMVRFGQPIDLVWEDRDYGIPFLTSLLKYNSNFSSVLFSNRTG